MKKDHFEIGLNFLKMITHPQPQIPVRWTFLDPLNLYVNNGRVINHA